jgi:DNA-nicking Smr family endonuclease
MRKPPPADQELDEDAVLWQRVTQRVTPLAKRDAAMMPFSGTEKSAEKPVESPAKPKIRRVASAVAPIPAKLPAVTPVDLRQGERAGLDGRTQRRLFRGDVPIDRRLDLHGYTAARAESKLQIFIQDAAYAGCRCVLIITGKGAGVLRGHLSGWLKREPLTGLVLAIAEARPADGGSGAVYVLLRRRRA